MAKKNKVAKVNNSVFTGRLLNLIGTWIVMILIIGIMAGVGAALVIAVGGVDVNDLANVEINPLLIALIVVAAFFVLLGLAWAAIRFMKWETKHTIISGNRVKFNANAFQLLGNCFKWTFLTIITVCIYALWLPIKVRKWKVKHMELQPVYGYDYGQVHFYNY